MLPKKARFSRKSFPKGRTQTRYPFSWGSISLYPAERPGAAVVISKKALPKAHKRNQLRRRIYAALSEVLKGSQTPQGIIVFPRSEALTTSFDALVSDLKKTLSK